MNDEFLTDPETGMKITLEEAEAGLWPEQDEFASMPLHEIEKLPTEEMKQSAFALNYFLQSKTYLRYEMEMEEQSFLNQTAILGNHKHWSHSAAFESSFAKLKVLIVELEFKHLFYWLQFESSYGHYFFRPKTNQERLFDRIKGDDDIVMDDYECLTYEASHEPEKLLPILELFQSQTNLEMEFSGRNFYVRTNTPLHVKDVEIFESKFEQLSNV